MEIHNSDFAYMLGNFMADGSFYKTGGGYRFEFVDGSPYTNELKYSREHLLKIKSIFENFLNKKLPSITQKGNKFILRFRSKSLSELFIEILKILPGKKYKIVDIPKIYKNSINEVPFWRGFLDGDGSISRDHRRVALESMSEKIINSFANFLKKNEILFSQYKTKRGEDYSYVVLIRSVSFRDFASRVGFLHPNKSRLLNNKLKNKDFFVRNKIIMEKGVIDYCKIFDNSVFIENGRQLFIKYGNTKYHRPNVKFNDVVLLMKERGIQIKEILKEITKYRFKKSKGSMNSIKLPLYLDDHLLKIARFVRLKVGGISFSKVYINSFGESYEEILTLTKKIFDIKPIYTSKNEPLFCSGVLKDLFNRIIERS